MERRKQVKVKPELSLCRVPSINSEKVFPPNAAPPMMTMSASLARKAFCGPAWGLNSLVGLATALATATLFLLGGSVPTVVVGEDDHRADRGGRDRSPVTGVSADKLAASEVDWILPLQTADGRAPIGRDSFTGIANGCLIHNE